MRYAAGGGGSTTRFVCLGRPGVRASPPGCFQSRYTAASWQPAAPMPGRHILCPPRRAYPDRLCATHGDQRRSVLVRHRIRARDDMGSPPSRGVHPEHDACLGSCNALLKMLSPWTDSMSEVDELRVIGKVHICDGHLLLLHPSRTESRATAPWSNAPDLSRGCRHRWPASFPRGLCILRRGRQLSIRLR